jgi:hypothetical protein
MEEETIFEEGDARITNLRAIISGKTFAMSNITSVSLEELTPSNFLSGAIMIGSGLAALLAVLAES